MSVKATEDAIGALIMDIVNRLLDKCKNERDAPLLEQCIQVALSSYVTKSISIKGPSKGSSKKAASIAPAPISANILPIQKATFLKFDDGTFMTNETISDGFHLVLDASKHVICICDSMGQRYDPTPYRNDIIRFGAIFE